MSEYAVVDELANYGEWLERTTGLALRPGAVWPDDPEVFEIGLVVTSSSPPATRVGRRVLVLAAVAAALVLVALIVSTGYLRESGSQFIVGSASLDPPGPLYVLPAAGSGFEVANGYADQGEVPLAQAPSQVFVVGRSEGDLYFDLATVRVGQEPADFGADAEWELVELANGPAQVLDDFMTVVAQQRNGVWVSVTVGRGRLSYAVDLMEAIEMGPDGVAQLDGTLTAAVLEDMRQPFASGFHTTSFEIVTDSSEDSIVVETATMTSPLIAAAAVASIDSTTTVRRLRDTSSWQLIREDPEGQWNGVAWQATPNRIIAVSGHVPLAEVTAIAESLTIVDEATWQAALPGYTDR